MFEADDGFYLARVDSLAPGGLPSFAAAKPTLRKLVAQQKALDQLRATTQHLASQAAATSMLGARDDAGSEASA